MINLRIATAKDEGWLFALYCQAFEEHIAKIWGWDEAWQIADFERSLRETRCEVVELNSSPIGFIRTKGEGELYIDLLVLSSAHQGRGFGAEVLRQMKRFRSCIRLKVFSTNERARRFYLANGFRETGRDSEFFSMIWVKGEGVRTDEFAT